MLRKFLSPEILFGNASRNRLADYLRRFGSRRVFLVSDSGLRSHGWTDEIESLLRSNGIDYITWDNVSPNPRISEVTEGASIYLKEACDLIVGLGGGSPMDAAKGVGIIASNGGDIRDYDGVDRIPRPLPPSVFIPSTSGTAADLSQFAILSDEDEKYKRAIISKSIIPDISIIDPEITVTMDPSLTAATGLDALTHAFEALASAGSGAMTDLYAREAVSLIGKWLVPAVSDCSNSVAREHLSQASTFAGLAFSNASLGAVHSMAHSLGGYLDLAHGECNALLLDSVVEWNFPEAKGAYRTAAEALGFQSAENADDDEILEYLIHRIQGLRTDTGMTAGLASLGVTEDLLPVLAQKAVDDPCMLTNPRVTGVEDLIALFRKSL